MNFLAMVLLIVCVALVAVAAIVCVYHVWLLLAALVGHRNHTLSGAAAAHSFAIVIPAHDEEANLGRTLASCAALDYPREKLAVYVIADNCTDRTADVATQAGATCLVRNNAEERGKGFALEWAIPQVLAAGHEAIVVLDADCLIDAKSLRAADARLQQGSRALQLNNSVANPDQNATSYLLAIANTLENEWFYAPKSALGMAVLLRGTGMVLHREVLGRCPWSARSAAEDTEYSYRLFRAGVAIGFVPECGVVSDSPTNRVQLTTQRTRWIGGGWRLACLQGSRLLVEGLLKRRWMLLDAGFTSFILSRPLILLQLFLTTIACLALLPTVYHQIGVALLIAMGVVSACYVVYGLIGAATLGLTRRRMGMLVRLPPVVVRYVVMALVVLCSFKTVSWNRTPRARV